MFSRRPYLRRRGVTAIEYGILAALIIVAMIGILRTTGTNLAVVFGKIGNTIHDVVGVKYPVFTGANYVYSSETPGDFGYQGNIYYSTSYNYRDPNNTNSSYLDLSNGPNVFVGLSVLAAGAATTIPGPSGFGGPGAFTLPTGTEFYLGLPNNGSLTWHTKAAYPGNSADVAAFQATIPQFQNACAADGGTGSAVTTTSTMFSCTLASNAKGVAIGNAMDTPYFGGRKITGSPF